LKKSGIDELHQALDHLFTADDADQSDTSAPS